MKNWIAKATRNKGGLHRFLIAALALALCLPVLADRRGQLMQQRPGSAAATAIHYWKFDESASPWADSVAATAMTSGDAVLSATGILNLGVRFASVGATPITINSDNAANIVIGGAGLTFTAWVKFASFGTSAGAQIFSFTGSSPLKRFRVVVDDTGTPNFYIGLSLQYTPTATFALNQWTLVRIQYDNSTKKFGFQRSDAMNGIGSLEESAVVSDLAGSTSGFIQLSSDGGPAASNDYIEDECGLWNRLLSSGEHSTLYGGGSPPSYPNVP